jgi:hypothetical protein
MHYLVAGMRCLLETVFLASCVSKFAYREFVASAAALRLPVPPRPASAAVVAGRVWGASCS